MQKDLSRTRIQRKSFIKLIALSAFLALIVQLIYEYLSAGRFYGEESLDKNFSINTKGLLLYTLYEYIICFFVTFLVLFGARFLYYYFVRQKAVEKFP